MQQKNAPAIHLPLPKLKVGMMCFHVFVTGVNENYGNPFNCLILCQNQLLSYSKEKFKYVMGQILDSKMIKEHI